MNKSLTIIFIFVIAVGLLSGVRFIGSTIHYGCHREPIVNVEGGDDCAPPIWGLGQLSFYITGGSFNPFLNHDATTVSNVSWVIEGEKIAADVTTYDGKTKRYDLGTAPGCSGAHTS